MFQEPTATQTQAMTKASLHRQQTCPWIHMDTQNRSSYARAVVASSEFEIFISEHKYFEIFIAEQYIYCFCFFVHLNVLKKNYLRNST